MRIKRLNEQQYFSQSFSGDGYNTSNGVFRVQYKPYNDLSISRGRDFIPSQYIKGQDVNIGDVIRGKIIGSEKHVIGQVVSKDRDEASSEYRFHVKSIKTNKVFPVIPASIEHIKDVGFYQGSKFGGIETNKEKMALQLKYNHGGLVWGKLESRGAGKGDVLLTNNGQTVTRKGILDGSLTMAVVDPSDPKADIHHPNFQKLGIAYMDPATRTIYIDASDPNFDRLTDDHLITIEAHEMAHNMIKDIATDAVEILCDLVAARILRNKGYISPYKIVVSNFLGRHKKSYGECLDNNQETLEGIFQ